MNSKLLNIFNDVYGQPFKNDLEHRIMLQKAVYLLENMGLTIGDYSFSWHQYGPYSMALDCEAIELDPSQNHDIHYTEYAKECIKKVSEIDKKKIEYTSKDWMEAVASLHFLINVKRVNSNDAIKELERLKTHLNKTSENRIALSSALSLNT